MGIAYYIFFVPSHRKKAYDMFYAHIRTAISNQNLQLMKKLLLTLLVALATTFQANAQVNWEWGTPTWSIADGTVFESIDDLNLQGIHLVYPNPTNYTLTFFNILAVHFDVYMDDATEALPGASSAQMSTDIVIEYPFVEGHKYRLVTTSTVLAQANLATFSTDTLSISNESYSISFSIKGPELVKTIDVEGTMALTITSQDYDLTYSLLDVEDIKQALGISDISEATVYGLNGNGSYNSHYIDPFDGWRDADGEYTVWGGGAGGGVYELLGHNPYPAVYSIKISQNADSIYYYFYDYWTEYDPNAADSIGGGTIQTAPRRAPETHYHNMVWDWDNGDGTITQYTRRWRCDEGSDYKAGFAIIANKKMVRINATLHFVSQEEYAALMNPQTEETGYFLVSDLNSWSTTDQSYAFTKLDDGKTWQITIPGDRPIYAKIAPASAYADQENFWSLLLCAPTDGFTELTGSMVINGGAWHLSVDNTKEYTISIVPSEMTFAITATPNDEPIVPEGPKAPFYLVGGITNWSFDATRVFEAQADGQSYALTFPATYDGDGNCWFKIAPANAISDGAIIWANMLCAPSDGDSSLSGTMVVGDAGAWCLKQKEAIESYTITIVPSTLAYEIKENFASHVATINTNTHLRATYNLAGQRVAKPRRGLNIVDTNKGYRKVFVEE